MFCIRMKVAWEEVWMLCDSSLCGLEHNATLFPILPMRGHWKDRPHRHVEGLAWVSQAWNPPLGTSTYVALGHTEGRCALGDRDRLCVCRSLLAVLSGKVRVEEAQGLALCLLCGMR